MSHKYYTIEYEKIYCPNKWRKHRLYPKFSYIKE